MAEQESTSITRRIRTGILLLAWGHSLGCVPAISADSSHGPNVVFILADDLGWGDLGCYGNDRIKTPNLDKLARQATLFTQFYVASGVCSPSRTAFLTGQFPARLRMHGHLAEPKQNLDRGMPNFLDPKAPLISRMLKEMGYATGHYGKWHLGNGPDAPTPSAYGFDEHRSTNSNGPTWTPWGPQNRAKSSEMIIDETIGFVERHKSGPFYVQAWLNDTHATLNPTPEQMKPYESLGPLGVDFRAAAEVYYAVATDADKHIGRLLAKLDALGLTDNTIVLFSSDNGPEDIEVRNASHSGVGSPGPLRGRKRSLYEGGVRVPFIVRWPKHVPAGRVDFKSVVAAVDLLPTLAKLTGVGLPGSLVADGEDVSKVWLGTSIERAKPLFWEWRFPIAGHPINKSPMLSMREGRWKLMMNPDRSRIELYDIVAGPMEVDNLADSHADVVERMSKQLLAWQATLPKGPISPAVGSNGYRWPKENQR